MPRLALSSPPLLSLAALALAACASATPPLATPCEEARPAPPAQIVADEPADTTPNVSAGACETEWLPEGVVVDLPPEEEAALVELVRAWLASDVSALPRIEHRRGILFAKSEDDEGADPPYPRSSAATSLRACGLEARWLRDHLRAIFAFAAGPDMDGVRCSDNVCCFPGMEFVSDRAIVFRRATQDGQPLWVIDSAYEVAEGALSDEQIAINRRYVAAQLERVASGTCPGEPPGFR